MSVAINKKSVTELAITAEETLKNAINQGSVTDYIKGYYDYEKAILYYEGVGKSKEALKLLERLETILQIVIDNGQPDAPYYDKLGPFFILYSRHFKARILEQLNIDLREATASRVAALDFALGLEWIEQVINIMIDLLIEDYLDHCLRYLKFTTEKKETLIDEIAIQIKEFETKKFFWQRKKDPRKTAESIYNSFLLLLGMMVDRYNKGQSLLSDGLKILRELKQVTKADLEYIDQRLMALEAKIRSTKAEEIDDANVSHVESQIIPHTLLDNPKLEELKELLRKFVKNKGLDFDVAVGTIPVLGANPAGSPHYAIIGQTGVGKTTLTKQILKENIRIQDCAVIVFDHHFEYADIADNIIQIGGERREEATAYFGVEEIGDTFKKASQFIQEQQSMFAKEGSDPAQLATKIKQYEAETRPTINKFIIETIEGLIDKEYQSVFPIYPGEITIFWVVMDEADIATLIVSTFIKHILHGAINEELPSRTILVTEEAQRLSDDKWIRNVASEGRKFGLFLISISQSPEFNPWVVSNSQIAVFRLRKINTDSAISDIFTPDAKAMIPNLEIGEYLSYHRDKRGWMLSYNPEALSPIHAQRTLEMKIEQLKEIMKSK